ncbi:MAG: translation initiation factor IF-5A [Candidatus Bathyarchaeia archaeon]
MPKHGLQARNLSKPVDVGSVKIGQYIIVEGEPCKIVEYEKSKPGKHGAAKARIVAISVTTGTKKNVISPVDARIDVPMIEKKTAQVLAFVGSNVQLMDMQSYETFETPMPEEEEIKTKLAAGVEVEYWQMLGQNKIMRIKG